MAKKKSTGTAKKAVPKKRKVSVVAPLTYEEACEISTRVNSGVGWYGQPKAVKKFNKWMRLYKDAVVNEEE